MSVLSSPQEIKLTTEIDEWLQRIGAGPVLEHTDDSETVDEIALLARKLLGGPLKRVTKYFSCDLKKTCKLMMLILGYMKETHPGLWEWVKGSRDSNFTSDMLNLSTNDMEKYIPGFSVYFMEFKVQDGKRLGQLLLSQPNPTRRTMDFVLDNGLLDMEENTPIVLKYVGQTSAVSPVTRLQQHLAGNSGAVLVESVVSVLNPAEILHTHAVLFPCATLKEFASKLGMDAKHVTNMTEIFMINLMKCTQKDMLFGLNVDSGSLFGEHFDAAAAGRQNCDFPPTLVIDMRELFVTGHMCKSDECLNVVRRHNDTLYTHCQKCSRRGETYVIATVKTDKNGRVGAVQAGDGMRREIANDRRRIAVQRSLTVYKLNAEHRCVPFLQDSLPPPLNELVNDTGHLCDVEGCSSRRRIELPHVAKRGKSNDSLTWGISSRCKRHYIKGESGFRRAYFDVQGEVWRWKT